MNPLALKNKPLHSVTPFCNNSAFYINFVLAFSLSMLINLPSAFNQEHDPFIRFDRAQGIPSFNNSLFGLYQDRIGFIWTGNRYIGLHRFDGYKFEPFFKHLSLSPYSLIQVDSAGRHWIKDDEKGLVIYDPSKGELKTYSHEPDNPNSLSDNSIMDVFVDSKKNIWAGTFDKGLNRIDLSTGALTRFSKV